MASKISLSKATYKKLLKKAQLAEKLRSVLDEEYPTEVYSDEQIRQFEDADRLSPQLRKQILQIVKKRGKK